MIARFLKPLRQQIRWWRSLWFAPGRIVVNNKPRRIL